MTGSSNTGLFRIKPRRNLDAPDSLKCVYGFILFASLFTYGINQKIGSAGGKDLQPLFGASW